MKILSTPYFDNNQLKEVASPTADTDAANKQYVDSRELDDAADVTVDNPSSGQVLKYNGTDWVNDGVRSSDIVPLLSKTYTNVLRNNNTYTSPYSNSYLYFGQVKPVDVDKSSMIAYHILAYAPSDSRFMLDAIVKYYFSSDGIYKAEYVWNNLNSSSYYPFGYHTLFRSNTKAISQSDGSYLGVYYGSSTSYGQSPHTVARTFVVDIIEAENCTYNLLDNIVWFNDTANLPENLAPTSESTAYNTTNFTAVNTATTVGLQETGDANQNTLGYQLRTNSTTLTAADYFGRYRLLFTSADNTQWVPATTSTSTNATALRDVNQRKINPFGRIEYYSATTVVQADTSVTATNIWDQYVLTLGYSFNRTGAALVLPFPAPVYVKCAPQTDGSAIIDSTTPYVHSLPSTDDGKIYILLGHTYSATNIELVPHHPVYYHDGTGIKLWTGSTIPPTVSGTNDGTNWTSLTIGDTTKAIPVGGGGSSTLSGLSDTAITSPSNGQILTYNSTSQKWVNSNASSDLFLCELSMNGTDYVCDKTVTEIINAQSLGKRVLLHFDAQIFGEYRLPLESTMSYPSDSFYSASFCSIVDSTIYTANGTLIGNTETWSLTTKTIQNVAFSANYNDLNNKPTIPPADVGTFTHIANTTVSTQEYVFFPENQRTSEMVSTGADLDIIFAVFNNYDNYLWIKNTGSSDIDITIGGVYYNDLQTPLANVYMPDDGISVPAGKICEVGIVCNADGAFITSRSDLSL